MSLEEAVRARSTLHYARRPTLAGRPPHVHSSARKQRDRGNGYPQGSEGSSSMMLRDQTFIGKADGEAARILPPDDRIEAFRDLIHAVDHSDARLGITATKALRRMGFSVVLLPASSRTGG